LGILAMAILFRSIFHLGSRAFYAQQDTRTPLYISLCAIAMNIALAIWFTMALGLGVFGLAAAQAISSFIEVIVLFSILSWRVRGLFNSDFAHGVLRMLSATGLMFVITYIMIKIFNLTSVGESFFALLPPFSLIVGVSLGSYLIMSYIFSIEEVHPVMRKLKEFAFNKIKPVH
jgi:putative peptidoglycan lipid II flippase